LIRVRETKTQDGMTRAERFLNMEDAIRPHPKQGQALMGASVLLVDDVMTSGATFAAATEACYQAGAKDVCVLALARVAKDT
jgi:predicted amidophosphoribosyltransferase